MLSALVFNVVPTLLEVALVSGIMVKFVTYVMSVNLCRMPYANVQSLINYCC